MLSKVADFFEQEVDDAVAPLPSLMEPLIMVVLVHADRRPGDRHVSADLQDGSGGVREGEASGVRSEA
jgi:hypothetical protein